ncbi:MAG: membrane protein insertion efficiency factor YidD [Actinobacteria bacterium]|nr:membrane protein insertion efficiency factor YidD [Actinomycetota bacterium]
MMGRIARRCVAAVEKYRNSRTHSHRGVCRFSPSCSTFALEALETRSLPVALLSIAWRIVRCNPLVRIGTRDPVRRTKLSVRPNSARTAVVVMFLGGLIALMTTGLAFGQGVGGGCSGTANGRTPASMTSDNPLRVGKGERVQIEGRAPSGKTRGQTYLNYSIALISGISEIDTRTELHGEGPNWRGSVNVSDYLRYGSGKYKVEGTVSTTQGSYSCPVSFYVYLDGNKIVGIVAAGVAGVGGLGVIRASRVKAPTAAKWSADEAPPPPESAAPTGDFTHGPTEMDRAATTMADIGGAFGCGLWPLLDLFFELGGAAVIGSRPGGESGTVWRSGKTGLGAFSGLVFGVGATIALQQFGHWTLTPATLFGFPVVTAIVGGIRARRGTAFKITSEEVPPPPPPDA